VKEHKWPESNLPIAPAAIKMVCPVGERFECFELLLWWPPFPCVEAAVPVADARAVSGTSIEEVTVVAFDLAGFSVLELAAELNAGSPSVFNPFRGESLEVSKDVNGVAFGAAESILVVGKNEEMKVCLPKVSLAGLSNGIPTYICC